MNKQLLYMENNVLKLNFCCIPNKDRYVPIYVEKQINGKEYIYWGKDNKFPDYLWDIYSKCGLLQSIINGCVDYTLGNEIKTNIKNIEKINSDGETLEDVVKKIIKDYWIFGNFALQIIYNKLGDITDIFALDVMKCRLSKNKDKVFYSNDFNKFSGSKVIEYEAFDPTKKQSTCIYFYDGHSQRNIYALPLYAGALNSIETYIEITKFHRNEILNNFSGSAIVNFNNGTPTQEVQGEIENSIKEKFGGAENAGAILVAFNDSKEQAVTVERLSTDDFDKRYEALKDSVIDDIFITMRAQPMLFGKIDKTGFNKVEYEESFQIFNKTVISPAQKEIEKIFNKIYNIDKSFIFTPFKVFEDEEKLTAEKNEE